MPSQMSIRSFGKWITEQQARVKDHRHRRRIECSVLFAAGFVMDGILSLDTIVTANNAWIAAGATSLFVTFLSYVVFPFVVDEGKIVNWPKLWSLGLGCAAGAMLVTAFVLND